MSSISWTRRHRGDELGGTCPGTRTKYEYGSVPTRVVIALLLSVGLLGCEGIDSPIVAEREPEGPHLNRDAGADASADAGVETRTDTGAGVDTGTDTGAGTDSLTDTGSPPSETWPTGQLDRFFPIDVPQRGWRLVDIDSKQKMMTVTHTTIDASNFSLWFFDKPGQAAGQYDLEHYRYCGNGGSNPWLFMDKYVDFDSTTGSRVEHNVQSTRILFTPQGGTPIDLMADGTYARCGSKGQPYLFWKQNLTSYRIQVWGTVDKDKYPSSNFEWYWDATVTSPSTVSNPCAVSVPSLAPAIKVKEGWWDNFAGTGVWSAPGSGSIGSDGKPDGQTMAPFRTVWHAEGQTPYVLAGTPDELIRWCVDEQWSVGSP